MEIVVGDGHCLLHAFAMSLEAEKITVSSIEDLCSKLTLNRPGFLKSSTAGGGGGDSAPPCVISLFEDQ